MLPGGGRAEGLSGSSRIDLQALERFLQGFIFSVQAHAIAQDNDGLTWSAYGQQVWPTLTLIDKRGYIRYRQVGAGGYDAMEAAIQALLAEKD